MNLYFTPWFTFLFLGGWGSCTCTDVHPRITKREKKKKLGWSIQQGSTRQVDWTSGETPRVMGEHKKKGL